MASDRRYKEIVPESTRRFEADHFQQPSDWYIRSAANVGVYEKRLEELFPSELLEGEGATQAVAHLRQKALQKREAEEERRVPEKDTAPGGSHIEPPTDGD